MTNAESITRPSADYTPPTVDGVREAVSRYHARTGFPTFSPRAALIDMDGTLLDSMSGHTIAWHRMVSELGIKCTREEFYLYEGMTGAETINMLFQRELGRESTMDERRELYARKTGYFNELPKPEVIPGALQMVRTLMEHGMKRVLVTGSGQLSSLERLKADFPGAFADNMRVTSHDVEHCKPHPEPYLKGMSLADVAPSEAIVVENAPLGVLSGSKACAFTVAVTTGPVPVDEMWKAGADAVFPDMMSVVSALGFILHDTGGL